ncbi:MAG TPA: hypothetical protein QF753_02770 [Victivallales bacterium]|jgi:hypothetical protein|nr:hypothetical protein [Victivallales bacterium]|tara:strand:+ start:1602 stop:2105 length:504 start_codon:yes stop_codon:yes gene_type:complete
MDYKTFLIQIAWPTVTIIALFVFKKPLLKIIPFIEEINIKGIRLKFCQGLKDTDEVLKSKIPIENENKIYSPIIQINDIWIEIEKSCQNLLKKNNHKAPKIYRALGSRIKKYNLIDKKHGVVLDKLRQLRNLASHIGENNISQNDANEFIRLSTIFIEYINEKLETP